MLEAFFTAMMILICIGTLAFAGLVFRKLFDGQR